MDRKALPIPAVEEPAAAEAVPAAGSDPVELPQHRPKKTKKQKLAAEPAPALKPAAQQQPPAAEVNRWWDADPEAADAEMTGVSAVSQRHEALDATHSVPSTGPKTNVLPLQPAQAGSIKPKKAARVAMEPSTANASSAGGDAAGLPTNINCWDADPEALEGMDMESHRKGMSSKAQAAERQHELQASPTANGMKRKPRPSKLRPVAGVSGDDLGDEFDIAVEGEEEEEGQRKKKGKRKQAGPGGKRDAARDLPAWQFDIAPQAKQMKQVVF